MPVMRILIAVLLSLTLAGQVCAAPEVPTAEVATPTRALSEPVGIGDYLKMFAGLAIILVLIVGMAWAMRRMGRFNSGAQGELRILAGLSVGQRERVVLLQVGKEQILIGVSPAGVNPLHKLEEPLATSIDESGSGPADGFATRLAAVIRGQGGKA